MNDIPEAEARSLLSCPLRCEGCEEWEPLRTQPGSFTTGAGVVDARGVGSRLYVQLDYRNSLKTRSVKYVFTVVKRQPYGRDRVYQLEIFQVPKQLKDIHRRSHEHFGDSRVLGDASWNDWGYDDVLAYFSKQTNIAFYPEPPHPEHFQLKG
jgi:hypothetical protein